MVRTILVTTGGTVTFKQLLDEVTYVAFFELMLELGVKKLYIQYGNEVKGKIHVSEEYILKLLRDGDTKVESVNEQGRFQYKQLQIEIFAFSNTIDEYIKPSDLVITHGGTGSIVDCLRLNKKVIVIPNETLMDNHQLEIANAFESKNYLKSLLVGEINTMKGKKVIQGLLENDIKVESLPQPKDKIIERVIAQELKSA